MHHMVKVVECLQNLAFGNFQLLNYKAKSQMVEYYLIWLNVLPLNSLLTVVKNRRLTMGSFGLAEEYL